MPLAAGTRLGRYEIQSLLGAGGMGEVYLARDHKLRRAVALKVLLISGHHERQDVYRFAQEARAASALNHPHIVQIYEVEETDELNYLVMEFVDGETLRQRLLNRSLELKVALEVAAQAGSALVAAHDAGIIHRDIKPENVMLRRDGYVKVVDFGLAKVPREPVVAKDSESTISGVQTSPGMILGTVNYMSPEQARGLLVDARTDIWSLGVVLYEMIAGRPPFEGATPSDTLAAIISHEPPPLMRFARQVPDEIEWLTTKALAKDREARYQTAREFLTDLRRLQRQLEVERELERSNPGESQGRRRESTTARREQFLSAGSPAGLTRRRGLPIIAALLAGVVLTAVVVALYFYFWLRPTPPQTDIARLNLQSGMQSGPVWSPDGQFIAYSSNPQGPDQNFDIWVQAVAGGDPIRLTSSAATDWQPDWSPDGKNLIVFRSEREGGGLFLVSAFTGPERKLTGFGYQPRWSPDGSRILFLSPGEHLYTRPRAYVLTLDETLPREVLNPFWQQRGFHEGSVDWHPDGQRISFWDRVDQDFVTLPITGGHAVKAERAPEVEARIRGAGVSFGRFRWARSGDAIYLEGVARGVRNIWRVRVDPRTLRWVSGPERLTLTGLEQHSDIALSADGKKLAYSSVRLNTRIWLFPFDAATGQLRVKEGRPITPPDLEAGFPEISADGRKVLYAARASGSVGHQLHVYTIADSQDRLIWPLESRDDYRRFNPRWSLDSESVFYTRRSSNEKGDPIMMLNLKSNQEQAVTSPRGRSDFLSEVLPGGWLLGSTNQRDPGSYALARFSLSSEPSRSDVSIIASDPEQSLWGPRLSPDKQWICFIAQHRNKAGASVVHVIPAGGGTPVPITDLKSWSDRPRWSPDGKAIYFLSNYQSYFLNLWKIPFDPVAGQPAGGPTRVTSFERLDYMLPAQVTPLEASFTANLLVLPIQEKASTVWVIEKISQ